MSDETTVIGSELAAVLDAKDKRITELKGLLRESLIEMYENNPEPRLIVANKIRKALEGEK